MEEILAGKIKPGDIVVIRYEGPEGRARDARDARGHRRDEGCRARRRRRARHRRALLGRHARLLRRSRRARSGRRRPDRVRRRRRRIVIDAVAHTIELLVDDAELAPAQEELEGSRTALHERLPRQVRQARPRRRDRRDHRTSELSCRRSWKSRRRGAAASTAHALDREIARVHAPDTWFLKRGTTPAALRHALVGNEFTAARRTGKQIILDTADPDTRARRAPRHERAGDRRRRGGRRPARLREQPAASRSGIASACTSPTAARSCCATRAGSARRSSTPTSRGSVPTRSTLTAAQLDHALGKRTAPVKAVLMDQARIAGLGNLLVDEALWRAGIDPARPRRRHRRDERRELHRAIRDTLPRARAAAADPTPATCRAISTSRARETVRRSCAGRSAAARPIRARSISAEFTARACPGARHPW